MAPDRLRSARPARRVPADRAARAERLLAPAAFATSLGNNVQLIAGALLTLRADRSMMAVGWLFIAVAAPQALLSPWFGRLADRADRRRLWIGCDLTSALIALALPVWLVSGGAPGVGLYAGNCALAIISALFFPASGALIKERVRPARLRRFSADYEMATQAGMLLSAAVGGLAVQWFGATALLVFNAATFVVSAMCVAAVGARATPDAPVPAPDSETRTDSDTRTETGPAPESVPVPHPPIPLGRLILLYAQGSVVVTVFNALLPVLVLSELHRGTGVYGLVDALGSLGFLLATGAYRVLSRRTTDLRIGLGYFLVNNALLAVQARFGIIGLMIGVPIGAFCFGQSRIAARNLLLANADAEHVGRAFGLANSGALAATIAVMPVVSAVTDHSSARSGFVVLAAISALAAAAAAVLLRSGLRLGGDGLAAGAVEPGGAVPVDGAARAGEPLVDAS